MLSVFALALALAANPAPAADAAVPAPPPAASAPPAYGPPAPPKKKPKLAALLRADVDKNCADARRNIEDKTTILVCGQPSDEYRLDPDIISAEEARRVARRGSPSRPSIPGAMPDTGICERNGGCRALESINWVGVALVAAQMLDQAMKGENVGKTFVTDPRPSEYDYYKMAKSEREAKELEQAANEAAARARDAKAARTAAGKSPPPAN